MGSVNHLLLLGFAVLMVTQSYAILHPGGVYVYMTNHPKSVDHYVFVRYEIGSEARTTNYEIRHNEKGCYNLTNFVVESMGSMGNHDWIEVTFGKDCVAGRAIVEHRLTEEESFSAINVYWYNKYSDDPENPPTCNPVMYRYHVIFTLSKDPAENVKQMIQKYVEENNIRGLRKYDPAECDV
ncbi:uncharacterized protein LOC128164321 [Crassostrea angulata]|uniref:uncharacterized protein LOC128164321 n=1 Tax=Magallana angulata TaxID=2784310 RepID=UPI0022B0F822|nr:uncharacterized protein LOC128164321 [Crassostrea angulata]